MANQYLVEIHHYISRQMMKAGALKDRALEADDSVGARYYEGQLLALEELRSFLKREFELITQRYY